MRHLVALFFLAIALPVGAVSKTEPSDTALKLRKFLNGSWSVAVTITEEDGKVVKEAIQVDCEPVASQFGTQCLFHWTPGPEELVVFGYDEDTQTVRSFAIDGKSVHEHFGAFSDENTLVLERTQKGDKIRLEKLVYKRIDENRLHWNVVLTSPEKKISTFNFVFTRKTTPSR